MTHEARALKLISALLLVLAACPGCEAKPSSCMKKNSCVSPSQAGRNEVCRGVIKSLEDRATGQQWFLMRDPGHPAGPARLVQRSHCSSSSSKEDVSPDSQWRPNQTERSKRVIHAGQNVVVYDLSPNVKAEFEAIAVSSASLGQTFNVRLQVGGHLMRAVATSPARAELLAHEENH